MKRRLSFRGSIIALFVGSMLPLLIVVGLVVYRLQQSYLLNEAQNRLVSFVQADVAQYASDADLTILAVNLGDTLRALGADMFIQDAAGNPVPPSLGTGPWLGDDQHRVIREQRESRIQIIRTGDSERIVYLAAVVDPANNLLGSVEASLSMTEITSQLSALRVWLTLILTLASAVAVALAVTLSGLVTKPLRSLVNSVERVRQGNLEARAPVSEVKELGQLAVAYNQMLDQISADFHNQARLAEAMRQFAADASHELRSPLSVFRNSVEMLDRAFEQNDRQQYLEILAIQRKEVDAMTSLVENLLLLARLDQPEEAVAVHLHLEEIHPYPFLEEIYERSLLLAKERQISLEWCAGENYAILADREMLRRALNNVIENAILYTPAGKKITLGLESQNGYCSFIVEDQGWGIPSEQLKKIFERFYRGDESRNRQTPGTGLGMAIVAAIVRAHGGDIQIESELGQGTCVRLKFKHFEAQT